MADQLRAVAAKRHDIGIALDGAGRSDNAGDGIVVTVDLRDLFAEPEIDPEAATDIGQGQGEFASVTAFVALDINGADQFVTAGAQGRLQADDFIDVDGPELDAGIKHHWKIRLSGFQIGLVPMQIQSAFGNPVPSDPGLAGNAIGFLLAMQAEVQLDKSIGAVALGGAVAQELQRPTPHAGIEFQAVAQRGIAPPQRSQQDHRRPRTGPG